MDDHEDREELDQLLGLVDRVRGQLLGLVSRAAAEMDKDLVHLDDVTRPLSDALSQIDNLLDRLEREGHVADSEVPGA